MSKARLCGYDVNGIRDLCARNWMVLPGEEEVFGDEFISRGDIFGGVVRLEAGGTDHWVGGKPAASAPHGRGDGWGRVGQAVETVVVRETGLPWGAYQVIVSNMVSSSFSLLPPQDSLSFGPE